MGGLNISCGNFLGEDKSGSAFEVVLSQLDGVDPFVKDKLLSGFNDEEYVLIETQISSLLVEPLRLYRDGLIKDIGHDDWLRETLLEESNGGNPTDLKWGEGRGWRLYCAENLLRACQHSAASEEPVVVCLG